MRFENLVCFVFFVRTEDLELQDFTPVTFSLVHGSRDIFLFFSDNYPSRSLQLHPAGLPTLKYNTHRDYLNYGDLTFYTVPSLKSK